MSEQTHTFDVIRQRKAEGFQHTAVALSGMADAIDRIALTLDDSGENCVQCGSIHYRNWPQRQLRARVSGASERLREIAEVFKRRSHDDEFIGRPAVGDLLLAAVRAVDQEGKDANANGDVVIPSHVFDLIQQALGASPVPS